MNSKRVTFLVLDDADRMLDMVRFAFLCRTALLTSLNIA